MLDDLHFNGACHSISAINKKQVLQNIAWKIGRSLPEIDMTWLANQLLEAEDKETSGVGGGVAIPHLKSTPLQSPFIMMFKLQNPIEFNSPDTQPVDLVCIVLSPQQVGNAHLPLLAKVTRLMRDEDLCAKLRAAESTAQMETILNPEVRAFLAA